MWKKFRYWLRAGVSILRRSTNAFFSMSAALPANGHVDTELLHLDPFLYFLPRYVLRLTSACAIFQFCRKSTYQFNSLWHTPHELVIWSKRQILPKLT